MSDAIAALEQAEAAAHARHRAIPLPPWLNGAELAAYWSGA